ncbi:GNAT family N-acetyltransferase [Undibacterium fentianense]|uniref:N-acetyltransferase n=1 Tax=Undibacterium fentianense TaxID=2828728 RepID=A0A941E063_9BURK|nr:GNAT family N-acetyltransferase [Undibacterium fentianense]MBR7800005.1 N-acetyltransferase [Undibacterium fentianense]
MKSEISHYRTRIVDSLSEIGQENWDRLVKSQDMPTPFVSFAFLEALHQSNSACSMTGWKPTFITVWDDEELVGALPLYEKSHSYGEYVFDWAWANAYHEHGLNYYPKLVSAIPFTPIQGSRLISKHHDARRILIAALVDLMRNGQYSSCHILFPTEQEANELDRIGFLTREGVQFHWKNQNYQSFEEFLSKLERKKRKNIRTERRKVQDAGIQFQHVIGKDISSDDWFFFKQCYDRTYREHHSSPYLNLDFFQRIGSDMPENLLLIIANLNGDRVGAALFFYNQTHLYGRYWGCSIEIPYLHFETAYYQALEFCIQHKIQIFEGGAQGEHKLARGFMPQKTYSNHFILQSDFAHAVEHFLKRETHGVEQYIDELNEHTPFKNDKHHISGI